MGLNLTEGVLFSHLEVVVVMRRRGGSTSTLLLDMVEFKSKRLISYPLLLSSPGPTSLLRDVAALSLLYRSYNGGCSR